MTVSYIKVILQAKLNFTYVKISTNEEEIKLKIISNWR